MAVLHRRVLRDRDAGRVVGGAPDARTPRHGGCGLRGVRPGLAGDADARAASGRGRCGRRGAAAPSLHRQPRALLLVSLGRVVAPAALWALALLLAILNAGLFVESAAGGLPLVSQIGSVLLVGDPAASGGCAPRAASACCRRSACCRAGADHAGRARMVASRTPPASGRHRAAQLPSHGLYLGLVGHLFLGAACRQIASGRCRPGRSSRRWRVITLATSAAALWSRTPSLHAAGAIAAAVVVAVWAAAAGAPAWGLTVGARRRAAVARIALTWIAAGDASALDGTGSGACGGAVRRRVSR